MQTMPPDREGPPAVPLTPMSEAGAYFGRRPRRRRSSCSSKRARALEDEGRRRASRRAGPRGEGTLAAPTTIRNVTLALLVTEEGRLVAAERSSSSRPAGGRGSASGGPDLAYEPSRGVGRVGVGGSVHEARSGNPSIVAAKHTCLVSPITGPTGKQRLPQGQSISAAIVLSERGSVAQSPHRPPRSSPQCAPTRGKNKGTGPRRPPPG